MRWSLVPLLAALAACASPKPAPTVPVVPDPAPPPAAGATEPAGSPSKVHAAGGMCGGLAGFSCAAGLYCSFAPDAMCGAADQTGTCTPIPEVCTEQYEPVCGCDDKTYGNACDAARAGISVGKKGECAPPAPAPAAATPVLAAGATCGTRGVPGECGPDLYCAFKTACGATDSGGVCTAKATMCTKDFRPVCGCDGKTYANACMAGSAGASVASQGKCKAP